MRYLVIDDETGRAVEGETYSGPMPAFRAMLILSAHEKRNGRTPRYRVSPPVEYDVRDVRPPLAPWVIEALGIEAPVTKGG